MAFVALLQQFREKRGRGLVGAPVVFGVDKEIVWTGLNREKVRYDGKRWEGETRSWWGRSQDGSYGSKGDLTTNLTNLHESDDAGAVDPGSGPSGTLPQPSRWAVSVVESCIVFSILGFLFGVLFPAVNFARQRQGVAPVWPWLNSIFESLNAHGLQLLFVAFFCVVIPLVMTVGLLAVRRVLPERARRYVPLGPYQTPARTKTQREDFSTRSGAGVAAVVLAMTGSALLVFAATHVRSDRTRRRPVVTYVGPAADWVTHLAIAGWVISLAAVVAALVAIRRKDGLDALSLVGIFLTILNIFGSCLFWAIVTED